MAVYTQNALGGGFHPITNAVLGLSRAFADPSYEIAGRKARQDADLNAAQIIETQANARKLSAATALDEQKFGGRASLAGAISGAFNPDGSLKPEAQAAVIGALSQGDQLGNLSDVLGVSQAFALNPNDAGYDDALRRSLVVQGHMPDEDFAGTAGRADAISARDAAEAFKQAVTTTNIEQTHADGRNAADNARAIQTNTADNSRALQANTADNARAIAIADADRQIEFDIAQDEIAAKSKDALRPLYQAFQDADGNVFTFDTHAANPAFTPALDASGQPLTNLNKIGTPGRGAAPKVYSLTPTALDDFADSVDSIGAALGYDSVPDGVKQVVAERASEIYGTTGNTQAAITQAYQELVEGGEPGFFGGVDAQLRATPAISGALAPQAPAAPAAVPQADANIQQLRVEANDAIARGADKAAVAARFKQQTGQDL